MELKIGDRVRLARSEKHKIYQVIELKKDFVYLRSPNGRKVAPRRSDECRKV